jgi:pimeloyl-ACP methyl ester carboxylesterase
MVVSTTVMPTLTLSPVSSWLLQIGRFAPPPTLRTFLRSAGRTLQSRRPAPVAPRIRRRQDAVLAQGGAGPHHQAAILRDVGRGATPTIVLGGFVPDSSQAVFLLRDLFLRRGDLYCVDYPRHGFHLDLLCAQLDDLVEELALRAGQRPVVLGISFGAGLVLEWLRRRRLALGSPALRGVVLVSPVACVEDLLPDAAVKPTTLLGRAIKPYLDARAGVDERLVEKSRTIFVKMFEAGAQNRAALKGIMTAAEVAELRAGVMGTISGIDFTGACERVQALRRLAPPTSYFQLDVLPLSDAPTLILYAEKEDAVIAEGSPTRRAFAAGHRAYFPFSECRVVANPGGAAVQHASLVFHSANFRPVFGRFYGQLRNWRVPRAA